MTYNFGDTVGFPEADNDTAPPDAGRLAGWFCRLSRREFSGLAQVETADKYVVFAFRRGHPSFVEDAEGGASLADAALERALITRDQYAEIVTHMTESLVANEDLVFAEQAVKLGFLRAEQVQAEMSERVRAKIIQAMSFADCRVELDDSPDALSGMGDFPQEVGPLVYMGVRTFYDEELLRSLVPMPSRHYMRLTRPVSAVTAFFALDEDETKLLRALNTEAPIAALFNSSIVDSDHALQLLALLHIAGLAEFATTPYRVAPDAERSGVRSASEVMGNRARGRSGSQHAMPAVTGNRSGSQHAMPAVDARRASTRPAVAVAAREAAASAERSRAQFVEPRAPAPPAARAPVVDTEAEVVAQALAEAKARAGRPRRVPGGGAARRLGQEIEQRMRAQGAPVAQAAVPASAPAARPPAPAATTTHAAANPGAGAGGYAKTHLQQLLARRRQAAAQVSQPVPTRRDPQQDLRQAQDFLRELHFARAEELLRSLAEQKPDDEVFRIYHLYAKYRAVPELENEEVIALRDVAKKLSQNDEHAGFAFYVLAHLAMTEKKDDLAEKLFRKAHTIDKTNKDAERHVLILERRKTLAAQADAQSNRKIFGITIASGAKDKV